MPSDDPDGGGGRDDEFMQAGIERINTLSLTDPQAAITETDKVGKNFLYRIAYAATRGLLSPDDIDDAYFIGLTDSYRYAKKALRGECEPSRNFFGLVICIVRRRAIDILEANLANLNIQKLSTKTGFGLPGKSTDPLKTVLITEVQMVLADVRSECCERDRLIVTLSYFYWEADYDEALTLDEIADLCRCSKATVIRVKSHFLEEVRKRLE